MVVATPTEPLPASPRHRDPFRALVAPATWLTAAHLLLNAVAGTVSTVVVVTGLAFSALLLPFALLGVPVWVFTTWVGAGLARLERWRYRFLLGVDVAVPPMPS